MKNHKLRNGILIVLVLGAVVALAILLGAFRSSSVASDVDTPLTTEEMQRLLPRGRELALAGDCFGCHSQTQGPRGAGGVPIGTPFGTLYSTNITPDPAYGIGQYTRADFHRVLRDGIAPGNRNLYPAMPYVFTQITTPEDIDALYAYLMSIPPMAVENVENTGVFEFPVRPFMNFWALLNFPEREVPAVPDRSEQWLRGAYLVQGLGHCGACHTPRNVMMGVDFSRDLQGGSVDGMNAPDITAEGLARVGFDQATLAQYLRTGIAPQGTPFGGMYTVVHFSTSAMQAEDVEAIATYLMTDDTGKIVAPAPAPSPAPASVTPVSQAGADADADSGLQIGRRLYMSACAGCHGAQGEGIPNVAPAMRGNATLAMPDPVNTLYAVLHGIPTQVFPGGQRMYAMPPFRDQLNTTQVAELSTWLRTEWGGQSAPVSASQVEAASRNAQ